MEIGELRINNILNFQIRKTVKQGIITGLSKKRIVFDDSFSLNIKSENIQPIPLTSEWLEKLGFKAIKSIYFLNKDFNLLETGDGVFESLDVRHGVAVKLYYIHELQNLYYCLTKKELKINE